MRKVLFFGLCICLCFISFVSAIEKSPVEMPINPSSFVSDGNIYIIKNTINSFTYYPKGNKSKFTEKEITLSIDIPEGIIFHGIYGSYAPRIGDLSDFYPETKEEVIHDKRTYIRHTITLPIEKFRQIYEDRFGYEQIQFALESGKYQWEKGDKVYWFLSDGEKRFQESSLNIVVLPPLEKNDWPPRFGAFSWSWDSWISSPRTLWEKFIERDKLIGLTGRGDGTGISPSKASVIELRNQEGLLSFWSGICGCEDTTAPGINKEGKKCWCPTKMILNLKNKKGDIYDYWKRAVSVIPYKVANWDYEPAGIQICFCPDCLRAFSEYANISLEGLDSKTILSKYKEEFVKFRCEQNAEIVKLYAEMVRSFRPDIIVGICNHFIPADPERFKKYCLEETSSDIRMWDNAVDMHSPMMYEWGFDFYNDIDNTVKSVKKPVWPVIAAGYCPVDPLANCHSLKHVRMNIFSAATGGAKGVSFWSGIETCDGLMIKNIAQTLKEVASVEDFFLDGKRIDEKISIKGLPEEIKKLEISAEKIINIEVPAWDKFLRWRAHSLNSKVLVSVFNFNEDKKSYFKLNLTDMPADKYIVYDPITEELFAKDERIEYWSEKELEEGILSLVGTYDVRFLLIEKYLPSKKFKKITTQQEIETSYKRIKKKSVNLSSLSKWNIKITYDDFNKDSEYEILVDTPTQKVWINPLEGGKVWGWEIKQGEKQLVYSDYGGSYGAGLFFDLFWVPSNMHWSGEEKGIYQVVSRKIEKKRAIITLRRRLNAGLLEGLEITKTYSIPKNSSEIDITYQIKNLSKQTKDISFWSHHTPQLGNNEVIAKGLSFGETTEVIIPTPEGLKIEKEGLVYVPPGEGYSRGNEGFEKKTRTGIINKGWIAFYQPLSNEALLAKIEYEKLHQVYVWSGEYKSMEWMYKTVTLKPGESWHTSFSLTYLKDIKPDKIPQKGVKSG